MRESRTKHGFLLRRAGCARRPITQPKQRSSHVALFCFDRKRAPSHSALSCRQAPAQLGRVAFAHSLELWPRPRAPRRPESEPDSAARQAAIQRRLAVDGPGNGPPHGDKQPGPSRAVRPSRARWPRPPRLLRHVCFVQRADAIPHCFSRGIQVFLRT